MQIDVRGISAETDLLRAAPAEDLEAVVTAARLRIFRSRSGRVHQG